MPRVKLIVMLAAGVLVPVSGLVALGNIDFSSQRVDRTRLTIETVKRGTMEVKVAGNGQLLSRQVEQLAARVPGRVAQASVKPGAVAQVGQVLVELTNPELVASAEEAQSAWEGAVADLQASEAELESRTLNQESVVAQSEVSLAKARLDAETQEVLVREGSAASLDLKRSLLSLGQLERSHDIEVSRLQKLRRNIGGLLAVKRSRVTQLARARERAKAQVDDLKVVAGISGVVQAITVEVGQQLQPGSPIGRLARQDQLYAELKIPAREATDVQVGQKVVIDTRNGTMDAVVSRVDPGVTDGTVVVDADLKGTMIDGARPQLPVEGIIYVTQVPNTLFVGKPSYVKSDASISVYKLDPGGQYATRININVGKVSRNQVQVLQGLEAGDQIITSEVDEWQGKEQILLK